MAERSVSVKLKADVASYVASMRAAGAATKDLEKAGRDLRAAHDGEAKAAGDLRVAQLQLNDLQESGTAKVSQLAAAEEKLAEAHRRLENAQTQVTESTKRWEAAQKDSGQRAGENLADGLNDGFNKRSGDLDKATEKVAQRTQAKFQGLQFLGAFAGLPAAAAVAGVGVAAALGVVPIAFGALAAAGVASNTKVITAWSGTAAHLKAEAEGWSQPFVGEFVSAADKVKARADQLSPEISTAFNASVPGVDNLIGHVLDLTTNVMPGLVVAAKNSQAPLEGIGSLLDQTGTGLTQFFVNAAAGAKSSQAVLVTTGGIIHDLEGFAGSLFARLTNNGNPALQGFRADLQQVQGVILTLTGDTSALYPAVSGFLSTVSGGLGIVEGFAGALGHLPPQVSQFGGSLFATQKIAGLFGTSLTATGFGLKAFSTSVDEAGNKTTPFKTAVSGATGFVDKFAAGAKSVVASGFNPLGLALVAGSVLLDIWGKKSQDAATRAAEQAKAVDDLTTAFQKDNGILGANVAAVASKALSDKNAYTNGKVFGASMDDVSRAGLGQAGAMTSVVDKAKGYITQLLSGTKGNRDMLPTILQNVDAFAKQGGNAADLVNNLSAVRMHTLDLSDAQKSALIQTLDGVAAIGAEGRATLDAAQKQAAMQAALDKTSQILHDGMTPGMDAAQTATANLEKAFAALNEVGGDVVAKGQAIIDILDQLSGKPKTAEEALQAYNDTIRDLAKNLGQAASDGSTFQHNMIDSTGAINTTKEAGSNLQNVISQAATNMASYGQALKDAGVPSDQIASKLGVMKDQLAGQLKQLGLTPPEIDKVLSHYDALPADIITALHLEGAPETQQAITNIVGQLKQVPENKGIHVQALTTEAQAALIQLGYHIVQLPNGEFQVFANTKPGQEAADDLAARTMGRVVTMVVDANSAPANGKITATVIKADGSVGTMTMDARTNPATGKLQVLVQNVNGAWGWMNIDAFNNAAKNRIGDVVRVANGSVGWVQVNAATGGAEAAINYVARDRVGHITMIVRTDGSVRMGNNIASAHGNIVKPMAEGGVLGFGSGGVALRPMAPVAQKVPQNTWRVVGDNLTVPEYYIPADGSARSMSILAAANADPKLGGTSSARPVMQAIRSGNAVTKNSSMRSTVVVSMPVTVSVPNYVGSRSELVTAIREQVRISGGDVQKVLGRR